MKKTDRKLGGEAGNSGRGGGSRGGAGRKKEAGGEVRVVSGFLRGRILKTPGGKTHPMGAREKLALFNSLAPYLMRSVVLDAFAGSGALGIEAFSRGARHVCFIEESPKVAEVIHGNLWRLDLLEDSEIFAGKASEYFTDKRVDVILADPPYDDFGLAEVASLVRFLKEEGIFVLSHPGEAPEIAGLKLEKTSTYASAHISVYVKY